VTTTALPTTGFADQVGVPGMLALSILLIAVIFLARRLRMAG
jgi:LPXTG-motif cell wall-anchored protein